MTVRDIDRQKKKRSIKKLTDRQRLQMLVYIIQDIVAGHDEWDLGGRRFLLEKLDGVLRD